MEHVHSDWAKGSVSEGLNSEFLISFFRVRIA